MSRLVALSGATGFVGRHLLTDLRANGYRVRILLRRPVDGMAEADSAVIGDLARPINMARALEGVDAVVHSAGLAQAMSGHPEDDYRSVNMEGTLALARAAEHAGATRFVFLSSVRAQTGPTSVHVLREGDEPRPTDAYGRSKLDAERGLGQTSLDWVALRPVLIYGPGALGNMRALVRLARTPYPLPFGSLRARRSLLAIENLAAAVRVAIETPGPVRRPFLVADDEPLTPPQIVAAIRGGLGRSPGVVPCPTALLALAAKVAGRTEAMERLSGDLVVDTAALSALGWAPVVDTRSALAAFARAAG
ncbi:NAD-dependent epimerase/dehydratase family protein [Salinarimonas sp. NSM]|uniref:NAD-dependent epimerase/dehydratase family protein n=1 Tax=Salinarimonas sp. NSM TaxID=3458003 RepID=UPI004037228B